MQVEDNSSSEAELDPAQAEVTKVPADPAQGRDTQLATKPVQKDNTKLATNPARVKEGGSKTELSPDPMQVEKTDLALDPQMQVAETELPPHPNPPDPTRDSDTADPIQVDGNSETKFTIVELPLDPQMQVERAPHPTRDPPNTTELEVGEDSDTADPTQENDNSETEFTLVAPDRTFRRLFTPNRLVRIPSLAAQGRGLVCTTEAGPTAPEDMEAGITAVTLLAALRKLESQPDEHFEIPPRMPTLETEPTTPGEMVTASRRVPVALREQAPQQG